MTTLFQVVFVLVGILSSGLILLQETPPVLALCVGILLFSFFVMVAGATSFMDNEGAIRGEIINQIARWCVVSLPVAASLVYLNGLPALPVACVIVGLSLFLTWLTNAAHRRAKREQEFIRQLVAERLERIEKLGHLDDTLEEAYSKVSEVRRQRRLSKQLVSDSVLQTFRWFCKPETREVIDLAIGDLNRDIKEMRAEGRRLRFIKVVVFWRSLTTVGGIAGDKLKGGLEPIIRIFKLFG
jgi:hypothetical protein